MERSSGVVVTWARPDDTPDLRAHLDSRDLARVHRLRCSDDVRRLVTAHALLRLEVARWMGVLPKQVTFASTCRGCGGAHGKPHVVPGGDIAPPHVSLTYSGEVVLVALTSVGPVGVDVEVSQAASFDGFESVGLHPLETAETAAERTTAWVRKESVLKATGDGLLVDPRTLRVSDSDVSPALISWDGPGRPGQPLWMHDVHVDRDHAACVAVLGAHRPELTVRAAASVALRR